VVLSVSLADAECLDLSDIVNTDRYPLHDPDSPRLNDLVAACRAELAASGSAVLHDFLRPEALERAREVYEGMCARLLTEPAHGPVTPAVVEQTETTTISKV